MAKQRKKRKSNPNGRRAPVTRDNQCVRLSQCMIVKNEEKNIERALSWAKDIAFEQIVVDTGSTDRTVELAGRMGAKVFHFEWINDFAAAKNYAIEQAGGDWIAFLDADEYFTEKDANTLWLYLNRIEATDRLRAECRAIDCPLVQLDEKGAPTAIFSQIRIFRNSPDIRYMGAIHEALTLAESPAVVPDISILHTGYAAGSVEAADKSRRNVEMLMKELARDPDNINVKGYLADSLRLEGEYKDTDKAATLYREVINSKLPVNPTLKQNAYNHLIMDCLENQAKLDENIALSSRAVEDFPDNPDFSLLLGSLFRAKEDYVQAWEYLKKSERLLTHDALLQSTFAGSSPAELLSQLLLTADALGLTEEAIRYATLLLKYDKYAGHVLAPYIYKLRESDGNTTGGDIINILAQLYDLTSTKDKLFVLRAAKDAGDMALFQKLYALLTPEELEWLSGGGDGED